jgi:hypothetical protein
MENRLRLFLHIFLVDLIDLNFSMNEQKHQHQNNLEDFFSHIDKHQNNFLVGPIDIELVSEMNFST